MHSVLLVVEKPRNREKQRRLWSAFLTQSQNLLLQAKGIQTLAENVWMTSLADGELTFVSEVIALAAEKGLLCKTLFFRKEPQWIYSSKPPNHEENNEN